MIRVFKYILFPIVIFCSGIPVYGQHSLQNELPRVCGSEAHYPIGHPLHESFKEKRKELEKRIDDYLNSHRAEVNNGIVTIPIVYHVLHEGTAVGVGANLAASQLQDQLDQLNDDFRRTNSDAGNTLPGWSGVWADTEIDFCLASYDPIGYPTSGINRYLASDFSFINLGECISESDMNTWVKPETIWDPDRYLNIWVVPDLCGLFGYATFPDLDPEDEQGVVVYYATVGSLANPNPTPIDGTDNRRLGRTLTHEVGHFFNLYHTFQDGCSDGDMVIDTPPLDDTNFGCDLTYVSCNGYLDMAQNYMGYADDDCVNLFTEGQKTRMHAALQVLRPELMNAICGPPIRENDLCIDATIAYSCNSYLGNTIGASNIGSGPTCIGGNLSPGVWYLVPGDGTDYTVSTCGTASFDTVIDIYTGTCGSLSCHASNDQACAGGSSEVTFPTTFGQNYYIYVHGYFSSDVGIFELNIYKTRPITSTYTAGPGTLRDAIECAPLGAVITIPSSFHNQPFVLTRPIIIEKDITIQGSPGANIEIDGSGYSGAIFKFNGENLTLRNLVFTGGGSEEHAHGGAVMSFGSTTIIDCEFRYNGAARQGGAVKVVSAYTFNLINCLFTQNESFGDNGEGGALWTNASYINFVNNTFVFNAAGLDGGAIYFGNGIMDVNLINNTIATNVTYRRGGGLFSRVDLDDMHSNIFASNVAGLEGPEMYRFATRNIHNASNNLIQDSTDADLTSGFIVADPLFVDTPAGDFSLSENSPCVDAGNNNMLPQDFFDVDLDGNTSEILPIDVIGNPRVLNQNVDMGSIERIPNACEINQVLICNSNTTVNLDQALVSLDCGPTYPSSIYSISFDEGNVVSISLSAYTNNKWLYLYDSLCEGTCTAIASSSSSGSTTQSISYTFLPGVTYYLEVYDANLTGGNAELSVSCTSLACFSDLYLTSPIDDVSNGIKDFYTDESIFASNKITETGDSYFVCGSDTDDKIVLLPGFEVKYGGRFRTYRNGCSTAKTQSGRIVAERISEQ